MHPDSCDRKAEYNGYYYTLDSPEQKWKLPLYWLLKIFRKTTFWKNPPVPMCEEHYIENQFGYIILECDECKRSFMFSWNIIMDLWESDETESYSSDYYESEDGGGGTIDFPGFWCPFCGKQGIWK